MVAGPDRLDLAANLFHNTGALMPQHHRTVRRFPVMRHADIRVANTAGNDPHQRFIIPGAFHPERFYFDGAILLAQDSRADIPDFQIFGTKHRGIKPLSFP
jgi:hypothetical protein